jgi:hypothetical protein
MALDEFVPAPADVMALTQRPAIYSTVGKLIKDGVCVRCIKVRLA